MENKDKIILHLCASKYGSDSKPYRDAGYDVRLITEEIDIRKYNPPENVYGIIANPPCTMFSIARTTAATPRDLEKGMELVKECLRIIWQCQYKLKGDNPNGRTTQLQFWAIENPGSGLLRYFLGKPAFEYSPSEFGDNFSKATALWGIFNEPQRPFWNNQIPKYSDVTSTITPMSVRDPRERTDLRSIASPYFTKAFYMANP